MREGEAEGKIQGIGRGHLEVKRKTMKSQVQSIAREANERGM